MGARLQWPWFMSLGILGYPGYPGFQGLAFRTLLMLSPGCQSSPAATIARIAVPVMTAIAFLFMTAPPCLVLVGNGKLCCQVNITTPANQRLNSFP